MAGRSAGSSLRSTSSGAGLCTPLAATSSCSTSSARSVSATGTSRWSWWKPARTLQLIFASVRAALTAAVRPIASSEECTWSVIQAATKS